MKVVTGSAFPGFRPGLTLPPLEFWESFLHSRRIEMQRFETLRDAGVLTEHQITKLERGRSFHSVKATVGNVPTVVIFGGKEEFDPDPGFLAFLDHFNLLIALVGGSWVQGMGPGNMELAAKSAFQARERVKALKYSCHWNSKVIGVPLDVKMEPLHEYCDPDCLTLQICQLKDRVDGLFSLGYPMLCLITRGGDCTEHEVITLKCYCKNRVELETPFQHLYPETFFIDGPDRFWEPRFEQALNMVHGSENRCARKAQEFEEMLGCWGNYSPKEGQDWLTAAHAAAYKAFDLFCKATARTYGARADEVFRFDNGLSVVEAANRLIAREADDQTIPFGLTG